MDNRGLELDEMEEIPMTPMGVPAQQEDTSRAVHPTLVRRTTEMELIKVSDKYVVYNTRWLVLATCCVLALSNSMQWMSYTTLTAETDKFYCNGNETCDAGLNTNQIFQIVAVVTGIGGMYITDHFGIRLSIYCGVVLNIVGSLVRLLSSIPAIQSHVVRLSLLYSGSVIVAAAQAFFLVLPSKIAECWFPENQRALANVLSFIANPFGVVLGTMVPLLIFSKQTVPDDYRDTWDLFIFNAIMSLLAIINGVMAAFNTRSIPRTPPSPSNALHAIQHLGFWGSIRSCLMERQFIVQMFTFSIAFAQLWGFMVILPEILQLQNYVLDNYCPAICAFVGVIASLAAGFVCDRWKCFKETIKMCSVGFAITAIGFRLWLIHQKKNGFDEAVNLVMCSLLGVFSIPQFPIGIEMGVETTFPVYEATSSGLLVLSGQLCMFAVALMFNFSMETNWLYSATIKGQKNWQFALDLWCVLSVSAALIAVIFLNPYYKRIAFEREMAAEDENARANDVVKHEEIPGGFGEDGTVIIERL